MVNPVVQQCWDVRAKLVKELGGVDGLFDELERLDRKRLAAAEAKKKAKPATTAKKRTSPAGKKSKTR